MHGGPGATIRTAAATIPAHANPPAEPRETTTGSFVELTSYSWVSSAIFAMSAKSPVSP
jgi:hypothetical protein